MKKRIKWIIATTCLLQLTQAPAVQKNNHIDLSDSNPDPFYRDFQFDSAKLLKIKTLPGVSSRLVFNTLGSKESGASQSTSNGFFLYKLEQSGSHVASETSSLFSSVNTVANNPSNSSLYGHLFQRLMQHLFIDLAGGYEPNTTLPTYFSDNVDSNKANIKTPYTKNWFASASALFTHTWKEFAFNANLGLTHAEANQDPFSANYFSTVATVPNFTTNAQNAVSFIHENAEVSYRPNALFQPFVAGGLLQVVNLNNNPGLALSSWGLPSSLTDTSLDTNGYKVGGGLSLNYKQYMLRLEQQYFQRGNLYRNNQSTLSFKVNLG